MTANNKQAEEVQRLFSELDEAYARAAEAASPRLLPDAASHSRFADESGKAATIIRRIREIEGFK